MFQPQKQQMQRPQKPKKQSEDCIVDVKKTKTGKRIVVRGKCTKEKLDVAKDMDSD